MQVSFLPPPTAEVIEVELAHGNVADDRIPPIGQSDGNAGRGAAEEFDRFRAGRRKLQSLASGSDGHWVANLGLDCHDVTH